MKRRTATRTTLVTLGLLTLAACLVNLSFEMKKSVAVQTQAGVTNFSQNVIVNLADYPAITEHQKDIKSFDLDSVDARVSTVNAANKAQHVSGTLVLRKVLTDATHDVAVGSISNVSVAVGQSVNIKGTPELDAFLLQQLQEAGTFYAVITNGTVDGVADLVLDLNMHVSIGYDAGIL
jgi:hypothetical protein